jgi:uncharacterized protein
MGIQLILNKKPKGVTILEGFPGIGLVGTITTEYLVEHLQTEQIGSIIVDNVAAMIAVHDNKVVEPISLHYNKKYNLVLIHAISAGDGVGWKLADTIMDLAKQLQAKEIVCVEGVGSTQASISSNTFYFSTDAKKKKALSSITPLEEGIIVGVTGALMVRAKNGNIPITALFAETHSKLPDSKAAAAAIGALDTYLKLNVDPKPLLKQAEEFEKKLKSVMSQTKDTRDLQEKKMMSYVG